MSETRVIQLLGRELRIRSDEAPEHLQALGRYVDDKVQHITGKKPDGADPTLLMVTALQLADEIFKLRAQQAELTAKLRSSSRSLLGRIEVLPSGLPIGVDGHSGQPGFARPSLGIEGQPGFARPSLGIEGQPGFARPSVGIEALPRA